MNPDDFPTTISPTYELPLSLEAITLALRQGHGRVFQHAIRHEIADRIDIVIDACLINRCYDAQCEGDRARWMLDLIDAAGANEVVLPKLPELSAGPADPEKEQPCQRVRCLEELACRGQAEARSPLYGMFRQENPNHQDIGNAIIKVDGVDGLLYVAEKLGQWDDEPVVLAR